MSLSSMPIAISKKSSDGTTAHSAVDNLALRISQLVMANSSNPASVTLKVSVTSSPCCRPLPTACSGVRGRLATQDGHLRAMDQDRRGQKMLRTGRLSGCMSQKPTGSCLHHCCLVNVKTLCHVGGPMAITWNPGASRWTQQLRVDYANDWQWCSWRSTEPPTGKCDDGPREWMPPDKRNSVQSTTTALVWHR